MAISYPRYLPDLPIAGIDMTIDEGVSGNSLRNGSYFAREGAEPIWKATITTPPLLPLSLDDKAVIAEWRAWWLSLRGMKRFYLHDPGHAYPINHPNGTGLGGWGGLGGAASISAYQITASGVNSALQMAVGDYVGLVQGNARHLFMVTEAASASGTSITLSVEPYVNELLFQAGTVITNFFKPHCIMVPLPGSFKAPRGVTPQPISFQAVQKLV